MNAEIPAPDTKDILIQTTAQLIGNSRSTVEITIRKITATAGVNLNTVNYHFGSKENLIREAVRSIIGGYFQGNQLQPGSTGKGVHANLARICDFLFDGSVAGLAGTAPETPLRRLWEELGVAGRCDLFDPDNFGSILLPDGRTATVWTDINRLESRFIELFPLDADRIREFARALKACAGVDIPFSGGAAGRRKACESVAGRRAILGLPAIQRYSRITLRNFLDGLKDPSCRIACGNLVHFGGFDVPLLSVLLPLAYAHRNFARAIEAEFLGIGGEVRYGNPVAGIVPSGRDPRGRPRGRVMGVKLADGSEVRADRVSKAAWR